MRSYIAASLFFFTAVCTLQLHAQSPTIRKLTFLSPTVLETSGLVLINDTLYTHNDSGGDPCIYAISKSDTAVLNTVCFNTIRNVDWEDIAIDEHYLYIGDFGNNAGARKNLCIYRIRIDELNSNNATIDTIAFSFGDQTDFAPNFRKTEYDCEALFTAGEYIYVLTKDWVHKKTKMYRLPKQPGAYQADPLLVVDTRGMVTGADFHPEKSLLALIGYEKRYPFHPLLFLIQFDEDMQNIRQFYRHSLHMNSLQTEGIVWSGEYRMYVSNEDLLNMSARLSEIDFSDCRLFGFISNPMPDPETLWETGYNVNMQIADSSGNIVFDGKLKKFLRNEERMQHIVLPATVHWSVKKTSGWFVWQ